LAEEEGCEQIEKLLPRAIMSCVNIAEVAKFLLAKGLIAKSDLEKLIYQLIDEIIPFDTSQALTSAEIYLTTKQYGLSLGDRACISLGLNTGYNIYTTDIIWNKISLPGLNINVIR
jgi:PIN domain nuclease of toxin-antitoxin system